MWIPCVYNNKTPFGPTRPSIKRQVIITAHTLYIKRQLYVLKIRHIVGMAQYRASTGQWTIYKKILKYAFFLYTKINITTKNYTEFFLKKSLNRFFVFKARLGTRKVVTNKPRWKNKIGISLFNRKYFMFYKLYTFHSYWSKQKVGQWRATSRTESWLKSQGCKARWLLTGIYHKMYTHFFLSLSITALLKFIKTNCTVENK